MLVAHHKKEKSNHNLVGLSDVLLLISLKRASKGKQQIIYIDEAHIHLDTDEGYGWSVRYILSS